jgi:hypothetical protein
MNVIKAAVTEVTQAVLAIQNRLARTAKMTMTAAMVVATEAVEIK